MATPYLTPELETQITALKNRQTQLVTPSPAPQIPIEQLALSAGGRTVTAPVTASQKQYLESMRATGWTVVPDGKGGFTLSMMADPVSRARMTMGMPFHLSGERAMETERVKRMAEQAGIESIDNLMDIYRRMTEQGRVRAEGALKDFMTEQESAKRQAEAYGAGTDLLAQGVKAQEAALSGIQAQLQANMGQVSGLWERALAKADEYVESARQRTQDALRQMDLLTTDILKNHEFSKAHAMQAAVQASLGQMNDTEAVIARRYGANSPEMVSFRQSKMATLAGMQSSINASYEQVASQIQLASAQLQADMRQKFAMYENYQEKMALEVYTAAAQADQAYSLQAANYLVSIEQLKMNNQSMLADWIANAPVFTVKMGSLMAALT